MPVLHSQPYPRPPGGKAAPGPCSSRWGKTTVQVIRFKLQIIKITIQNKKTTPVTNKPSTSLPSRPPPPTRRSRGRWSRCLGHEQGPLEVPGGRALASPVESAAVSRGQRSGAERQGWAMGCGGGSGLRGQSRRWALVASALSRSLGFLCLGDVDRVRSQDLLHAWSWRLRGSSRSPGACRRWRPHWSCARPHCPG